MNKKRLFQQYIYIYKKKKKKTTDALKHPFFEAFF